MNFAQRPKGLRLDPLRPERTEGAAIGHAQKGVAGRDGHENARVEERCETRHESLLPCASQSLCVVRRISVIETIVVRLPGHLVETTPPLLAFTVAVRQDVVQSQPAVPGLSQAFEWKLVFIQKAHQSVPTDSQERRRLLGRELAIDRFEADRCPPLHRVDNTLKRLVVRKG